MQFKKLLATAASLAALTLAACGGQAQEQKANNDGTPAAKVYRVSTNAEFAPFESMDENQQIHGFDIDIINAMAQTGGFEIKVEHKPWDSLFPALANGDTDILLSGITITEDRQKTMSFTDPYYQITQVILVPEGKNIESSEDLKNLDKVGVVTGQTGDFAAGKILGETNPKIARFESVPLMIKEVENGGVDVAISDSAVIAHYVKNNSDKGFRIIEVPDFEVENYGIAVRKDDQETLQMLNDALNTIRENGTYAEIESRYFAK